MGRSLGFLFVGVLAGIVLAKAWERVYGYYTDESVDDLTENIARRLDRLEGKDVRAAVQPT